MEEVRRRLVILREEWIRLDHIPDELAVMGLDNLHKRSVADWLDRLADQAHALSESPPGELVMLNCSCRQLLGLAEEYLHHHLREYPTIHMLGFLTLLEQLQAFLSASPDSPALEPERTVRRRRFAGR